MKTNQIKPIHDTNHTTNAADVGNAAVRPARHVFKLGLDVDMHHVVTANGANWQ